MAMRRLNKKVALVGSAILVFLVVGTILVILRMSKDPKEALAEAEKARLEKDYPRAVTLYSQAFERSKSNKQREEILLTIVDVLIEADDWDMVVGYWGQAITVNPKSVKARFGRLKYLSIVAESGSSRVWQQVQKDAAEFLEVAEDEGLLNENVSQWDVLVKEGVDPVDQSLGAYLYLARAKATLELAMSGAMTNKKEALDEVVTDLEKVKAIEPKNIEVYRYLAGAAVEKGKLLASKGLLSELDKAAMEAKTLLEDAVAVAPENPKSHINLIRLKLSFAQREAEPKDANEAFEPDSFVQRETKVRDAIQALEPDYTALAGKFPSDAEVHVAVSEFYLMLSSYNVAEAGMASLDKAITAAEKAVELGPETVAYVINAIQLHDRKFSTYHKPANLHRVRELVTKGLALPEAQDVSGPWSFTNKVNRYHLYSFLAQISINEVLEPSEIRTETQKNQWLTDAETAVHEIEQIFESGQEPQVVKWRGMLELANGQRQSAVRKLYAAYEQMKALKPSATAWPMDPQFATLCHVLARVFRDTSEVGAVAEFMTSGLRSGLSSIVPEARLDYAEQIMKFNMWSDAIESIDSFERRLAPNERSTLLRIEVYIGAQDFDKAAKELAARPENDPNTMRLSLAMVRSKIDQTQLSIARLENKEFLDVAFGETVTDAEKKGSSGSLESMRKELNDYRNLEVQLVNKLLLAQPDLLTTSAVIEACQHYVRDDNAAKAKTLIDQYLENSPEDTSALVYKQVLNEPKPESVSSDRAVAIEENVLSNISDPAERGLRLGIFYRRHEEYDKALTSLRVALGAPQAQGSKKPATTWYYQAEEEEHPRVLAVSHFFDIAIQRDDWNMAEEAVGIARAEDLDGCEGNIFAARLAFAKGQYKEAKTRVDESMKQRPIFARAYSLRSRINAALGDEHAAIEDVRRATSLNPLDGQIAKGYAQLLHLRNTKLGESVTPEQTAETRTAVQRAISLNPGDKELRRFFAEFITPTEPLKALAILQGFHKSEPTFETGVKLGELATQLAREETNDQRKAVLFEVAGSALEDARKMKPHDEVILYYYAEYLRAMGRDQEVPPILIEAKQMGLLWNHYYQRGQYEEAMGILKELYQAKPGDTQVIKGLVLVAEKTSDANAVMKYTDELIASDPNSDNYLVQIQSYLRVGLVSEATAKLQSFNEKYPGEPRILLLRAWLEMRKGQFEEALKLTNQYLETNPNNAIGWRLRGEIRFYEGDISKAIEDLEKSKSIKADAAIRVMLAKAYLRMSRFEDALMELKSAISSPGATMEARLLLEDTYTQLDRKGALGQFYAATINEFPTSIFWLNRAGSYALEAGDYDKASQLYSKSLELKRQGDSGTSDRQMRFDPQYAASLDGYLRSCILLAGRPTATNWNPKKLDEVFEFAKQYLDTKYSPLAYLRMAQAKLLLGHKRTAVEYCQKAVDEAEDDEALASEVLLRMFLLLGPEDVEKYCLEKLKNAPDSIPANFTLFNLYKVNSQYFKALPLIEKCIQLSEPDGSQRLDYITKKAEMLTLAYQRSSDNKYLKMAIADYKSLLGKMPNNTSVLNNLAYMLAESGENIGDALKYAEKVYNLIPNDPGVLDTYGYVLYKNGKHSEALGHLNAALQQYEQKKQNVGPDVYEHLGLIKEALGDKLGARTAYERALEVGAGGLSNENIDRIKKAIKGLSS